MGDIRALTPQELAEFVDRVEPVGSPIEARSLPNAAPRHALISCPNDLPLPATLTDLSITLTYTLPVRAIRKGNPIAKSRLISIVCVSHIRALRSATIFFSGLFFLSCGYRELISQTRQDTREPRLRNTPPGCPILLALWRRFVLPDGRRPRSKFVVRLATTDSSAGTAYFRTEGNRSPHLALCRPVSRAVMPTSHASRRPAHHHLATEGHPNEEAASHSI